MTWFEKYRPKNPEQLIGKHQRSAAKALLETVEVAQRVLFIGPSGTGKTTVAKMYAAHINNGEYELINCREIGVADIRQRLAEAKIVRPLYTNYTVFVLDEIDALSNAAQQQLLDIEDIPEWLVFLTTTKDPHKLRDDLRSRFMTFSFSAPTREEIGYWLLEIFKEENFKPEREAVSNIVDVADGNLRKILNGVEALSRGALQSETSQATSEPFNQLFKLVLFNNFFKLTEALPLINQLESIPGFVIALCKTVIKNPSRDPNKTRAVLSVFGQGLPPNVPEDVGLAYLLTKYDEITNKGQK